MLTLLLQFLGTIVAVWLMLLLWVKTSRVHAEAMQDVEPDRLRCGGCSACTHDCINPSACAGESEKSL